jgi:hypothetical protein
MIKIGYFGIPGRTGGKTHIVEDNKPICKVKLNNKSVFQWCENVSNIYGLQPRHIECEGCRKQLIIRKNREAKRIGKEVKETINKRINRYSRRKEIVF